MSIRPIEIAGLTKVYRGKRRAQVLALDGLDLSIDEGEVIGFLGPNGAGKSTTIKTLLGQIRPTSGRAALFGIPVGDPAARGRVGYLPENPAFYDFLTAREYLSLVGRSFGMSAAAVAAESDRVLDLLDLQAAGRRPIRGYSKGMVQRLGLAQALLHDPELYILDEPMSGLDPLGRALVKQIMLDLQRRGKTIFFSTHVTADVEAVCNRVAIIVNGRLQAVNQVNELLEKGIEGYVVQVAAGAKNQLAGFETRQRGDGSVELFVPRPELNGFLAMVAAKGIDIQLMEPRRRNLEQFFLDIVQREAG